MTPVNYNTLWHRQSQSAKHFHFLTCHGHPVCYLQYFMRFLISLTFFFGRTLLELAGGPPPRAENVKINLATVAIDS